MIDPLDFTDIQPYQDEEVPAVMDRLMKDPLMFKLLKYLFPRKSKDELIALAKRTRTIHDLQRNYSHPAIWNIAHRTTHGLTHSGFENLNSGKKHLIISNHRDILLDSAFLNILLVDHDMETVETGTGDNLFVSDIIRDLMLLNRTFIVNRSAPRSDMYNISLRLSHYMRHVISQSKASVWIAQRNGRTKDGDDRTETGLLKMLSLSNEDFVEGFKELNIIPMAISYEYDPCDIYKAQERYYKIKGQTYEKSRKDDLKSMLAGVTDHKGKVHLSIGKELPGSALEELGKIQNRNKRIREFASMIDRAIYDLYTLWPVNFIAMDLLQGHENFSSRYAADQKQAFEAYIEQRIADREGDRELFRQLMLEIYAHPVRNKLALA